MTLAPARVDHCEASETKSPGSAAPDTCACDIGWMGWPVPVPASTRLDLAHRAPHHRHFVLVELRSWRIDVHPTLPGVVSEDLRIRDALPPGKVSRTRVLTYP